MTAQDGAAAPEGGTIVIVAPPTDSHAATVEHVLRTKLGADVLIWDTEQVEDGLSFGVDPDRLTLTAGGRIVDLAHVRSVWWRRPRGYGLADRSLAPDLRRFCEREYSSLLLGGIGALGTNGRQPPARGGGGPAQAAPAVDGTDGGTPRPRHGDLQRSESGARVLGAP